MFGINKSFLVLFMIIIGGLDQFLVVLRVHLVLLPVLLKMFL